MPTIEYDLRYLRAGINLLEDYVLANDVYWPIGVKAPANETPYPRMTLGGVLLARIRLEAKELNAEQLNEVQNLGQKMDAVHTHWQVVWDHKAAAEFHARLNLWRDFLEEYRQRPEGNVDRYHYEVSRRVLLQLLGKESDSVPIAERELLVGLDRFTRSAIIWDEFLWEPELRPVFTREEYWFLYGTLKPN